MAADNDNLQTAFNRIKSVTPQVRLTPHYLSILQTLYPPKITYNQPAQHHTRHAHKTSALLPSITPQQILKTMSKQNEALLQVHLQIQLTFFAISLLIQLTQRKHRIPTYQCLPN
jgi:hypothetical protein